MTIELLEAEVSQLKDRLANLEMLIPNRQAGGRAFTEVLNVVSEVFDLSRGDIIGPGRDAYLVSARWCAMHLLCTNFGMSLNRVAKAFGRDHTSVLHAMSSYANRLEQYPEFADLCDQAGRKLTFYLKTATALLDRANNQDHRQPCKPAGDNQGNSKS